MQRVERGPSRRSRDRRDRSPQKERRPVDVLAQQMTLAKLARMSLDWVAYEQARDVAIHLALGHRVEDEVSRFRQVMTACTGWQYWGEEARELILKRLADAFIQGIDRHDSPRDVIIRMQRIPRAQAMVALATDMRRGDGELCIGFLLSEDGHMVHDVRVRFGDDPARIAARFTNRDWANFAAPLMAIPPGEPRPEVMAEARTSLRRTLSELTRVTP